VNYNTAVQPQPTSTQIEMAKRLEFALSTRNLDLVESAVSEAYSALHEIYVPTLIALAEAPWHQRHEDVVHALQILRSPKAISALEQATFSRHEYLAYDNNYALARKCTWALADIGTREAHGALTRIAECSDPTIAAYAKKRLDNWQREVHRKGHG